jgi:hypothetical protein
MGSGNSRLIAYDDALEVRPEHLVAFPSVALIAVAPLSVSLSLSSNPFLSLE